MANTLRNNLTSEYLRAAEGLKSKHARRRIVAYVESYDDIAFWRGLLGEFENEKMYFEVMLPSATSLAKGKKMVLMNTLDASAFGESMIACVDSDYDYLLQGRTSVSKQINESPYIFQTYAYAIENHLCFAESLHQVCVEATLNDRPVLDFAAYLERYSRTVYPLFLWNVWFYRNRDTNTFSMTEFNSYTIVRHFNVNNPTASLDAIAKNVATQLRRMERTHPDLIQKVKAMAEELRALGVTPETTYQFMQGHHIMDNVVMRLLFPVCTLLRREREEEIKRLAQHTQQCDNELAGYRNSQIDVERMIRRNYGYRSSALYDRIRSDLSCFAARVKSKG
jgi:hypothetical protein